MVDVTVYDDGSIILLTPETEAAREWVKENVQTDQWFGRAFAVERRYSYAIIDGMQGAGLTVG